jgi:CRISPR-associated protein Cas2
LFIDEEEAMKPKAQIKKNSLTTCYVIAYDIPNNKRRTKIHKVLLGFGKWTQYSLFECFLSRKDLVLLQAKLAQHLEAKEDSVRFYPLCANCVNRVETVGGPLPGDDDLFIM